MEGFIGTKPVIINVTFPEKNKMSIDFEDGRTLVVPLSQFPQIQRLDDKQRKNWFISDYNHLMFEDNDEVYLIDQFFGREKDYSYKPIRSTKRSKKSTSRH